MTLDAIDGKTDSVIATLNSCKKRDIKILPPDINHSESGFSVGYTPEGDKAVRFGLLAIKGVGSKVLKAIKELIKADGEFTSFQDFLDRTLNNKSNDTLKALIENDEDFYSYKENKEGELVKQVKNPFTKTNIIPLINAGAFDSLEENRYKTYNDFIKFRKVKKEIENDLKDENEYKLREKLSMELELLGYYVSQHPLDGASFPYTDLSQCRNGQKIRTSGIVKDFKKNSKPTKSGKYYYKLLLEFKDGTDMWINIWDNVYSKFNSVFKGLASKAKSGKEIVILDGKFSVNKGFTNINITDIVRIMSKQEELENTEMPENDEDVPELDINIERDSLMDEDLMIKIS